MKKGQTKIIVDRKLNKVSFYKNGKQIFPVSSKGNVVEFANGEMVLI